MSWAVIPSGSMGEIIRTTLGPKLAAHYEASLAPLPLALVELLARLCVAEAMGEYDRTRPEQTSLTLAVGDL
jgi:hypothetical protein